MLAVEPAELALTFGQNRWIGYRKSGNSMTTRRRAWVASWVENRAKSVTL